MSVSSRTPGVLRDETATYLGMTRDIDVHNTEALGCSPVHVSRNAVYLQQLCQHNHGAWSYEPRQLTTQALLGSTVLFRGSGCAKSSGL